MEIKIMKSDFNTEEIRPTHTGLIFIPQINNPVRGITNEEVNI
jgi:hypothetical protein